MSALHNLATDKSIIIKKADKSNSIVIMDREKYKQEIERQLKNTTYYEQQDSNPEENIKSNILKCMEEISERSNISDKLDTFPTKIRTPQFYVLPKTHKEINTSLPIGYPGRPIVSACSSPTEHISKYVDSLLQPKMKALPSYIKDTTDFINKLKNIRLKQESYLVTLDVASLYTNIPHTDGIDACTYFLAKDNDNFLSTEDISKLIKLVLESNYFQFDSDFFLQKMGTAMGSPMAPAYASLFMGKLEEDFFKTVTIKPDVWFRFLDDIFMVWNDTLENLEIFIDKINSFHPSIKFTHTISKTSVPFLDVLVSKDKSLNITTDVYVKETNHHQYLEYTSSHPKSCKSGIPFSQGKRYRRIISDDKTFNDSLPTLRQYFIDRNYPSSIVDFALNKVSSLSQDEALQPTEKQCNSVIPFTVCFNTSLPNIGDTINKYWDLLKLSNNNSVKQLHSYKPIMAYSRPKNIKDVLTRSKFSLSDDHVFSSKKCNRRRCSHCCNIVTDSSFTSYITDDKFNVRCNTDCSSKDVIYIITCKKCNIQYVGETKQNVSKRMNSHRFDIRNFSDPTYSSYVATHFNSPSHSIDDFSFMPIDNVCNDFDRLCKETFWIHKLQTLYPFGLNAKLLYDI